MSMSHVLSQLKKPGVATITPWSSRNTMPAMQAENDPCESALRIRRT